MHRGGLVVVLACACYDPTTVAPCTIRCMETSDCPGDQTCAGVEACTFNAVQTLDGFPGIHFRGDTAVWRADNFLVTAP